MNSNSAISNLPLGTGLNEKQREAVEAPHQPLLIVAGAGTGKTKTLTSRIVHILHQGAAPQHIVALTFTNKAAQEMNDRVAAVYDRFGRDIRAAGAFLGTFHALGVRILRAEYASVGRRANFVIFDDSDSSQIIKSILKSSGAPKSITPALVEAAITKHKADSTAPLSSDPRQSELLQHLTQAYEAQLAQNNAFDFDDLIEKPVRILQGNDALRAKYQQRVRHLFVDEYQDINALQYQLIKLLSGQAQSITVVGDDQQLIYGWRGSDIDIFFNFEEQWPNANVILLEQNYRSTSTIINAAAGFIAHNTHQKHKTLFTKNQPGELVQIIETASSEDEARAIGERIASLRRGLTSESIAVLYRTNAQSRAIEQALIDEEIPYTIFGGVRFYDRREIKDIMAAVRFAHNSADTVSRERLDKAVGKRRGAVVREALLSQTSKHPVDVIKTFLETTEYLDYIKRTFSNAAERTDNIVELVAFASRAQDISSFLEAASLLQATDTTKTKKEALSAPVALMSMHLAKGLEFDHVFVAGCCEGLLPHQRSTETQAQFEEERRLLYVAMTRAKKHLTLSYFAIPSAFLFEIPAEYTAFHSESGRQIFEDTEERYITLD